MAKLNQNKNSKQPDRPDAVWSAKLAAALRNDLTVISAWAFQWKMIFNADLTRQT